MPNRTVVRSLKSYVPARSNTSYELSAPSNGEAGVVGGSRPASMLELMAACDASIADGAAAVDAAEGASVQWAATAPRRRAEILRRAFELMMERAEPLARMIVEELPEVRLAEPAVDARADLDAHRLRHRR